MEPNDFSINGPLIGERILTSSSLGTYTQVSPTTGQPQSEVLVGGAPEIELAAAAATLGQRAWAQLSRDVRRDRILQFASLLEDAAPWFTRMAALECGIPVRMGGGVNIALSWFRYFAGWADKIEGISTEPFATPGVAYTRREPYGVVGIIIPWNFPLLAIAMTVVPAIAAGNAVILKPPAHTPFVALKIGELALQAGLPAGLINVVPGDVEAGTALIAHPTVGKISFTGGDTVARHVTATAGAHLKPVALELGGKSANIVFDDAENLDAVAQMSAAQGMAALSGQACVLPTRLYVQNGVFDAIVERIRDLASSFTVGDPLSFGTVLGPLISAAACDRVIGVIERAKRESGGTLVTGGHRLYGDLKDGNFIAPTLFADVRHDSHLAREEVFGPVLAVIRFKDEEDAVAKANDSRFGLGAYLHTTNIRRGHAVAARLQAGSVAINGNIGVNPNLAFGGYKQSGFGREGGEAGLDEFLQIKQVIVNY